MLKLIAITPAAYRRSRNQGQRRAPHNRMVLAATVVAAVMSLALISPSTAAAAQDRPNVLLLMSDDLNCDLGCYGHSLVQSPHIDRLAKRGVRFELAHCQYPVCNPSRTSLLTGLYPEQTGVLTNADKFRDKLPDIVTLPELFKQNGYFVARVGKIFHYNVPLQIGTNGLDDPQSWQQVVNPIGIDRTNLEPVHTLQKGQYGGTLSWLRVESDDKHTDELGAEAAVELLEKNHPDKTGKPFFLAVGFYRPHTPYVAPAKYFELYPREKIEPVLEVDGDRADIPLAALADRPQQRELTLAQRKEIIQAYYASTSLMDAQVGRLLDAVDRLKLADNTVIVFVSDHGYHLGQHGLWQKGDLFEGSTRVPLIVSLPGNAQAGKSTKAVTEMIDIYPTLAELCGLPQPAHLQGTSLAAVLRDVSHPGKETALTVAWSRAAAMHKELKGQKILGHSIRTSRYRYTLWGDGDFGQELYDYVNDPQELTNLADRPEFSDVLADLQRLLRQTRKRASRAVAKR